MFSPRGPTAGELAMQALSSVEGGYDRLAPKFDHTPFRTPDGVLDATAGALRPLGPFGRGLDVCCGTGAGMRVLESLGQERITGVDFSTGMLAQARGAHTGAAWVGRCAAARHLERVLGTARVRRGHAGPQCRVASPVRHVLRHLPAARGPRRPGSIRIHRDHSPLDGSRPARGRQPAVPACPRAQSQHALTAVFPLVRAGQGYAARAA
jgi:hypothetical protein